MAVYLSKMAATMIGFTSYTLTSAILKGDVVCDVIMTSTPNVLTTDLRDLVYNHCIDNTCCYSFFIYPTGRISVYKIRFVSISANAENLVWYARKKDIREISLSA